MHVFSFLYRSVLAAVLLVAAPSFAADAADCSAPDTLTPAAAPLPHVTPALKPGGHLDVLVVGSATVFSPSALQRPRLGLLLGLGPAKPPPPPVVTFPLQMANLLRDKYPGLDVRVTVKGGRGMSAADMLDIIHAEIAAHPYQLVIWQTGTVEAIKHVPVGRFAQTLSEGAAAVTQAGADLVLVDPQFSEFLHTHANIDPYVRAMQQAAARPNTLLFHRFDLTRFWAEDGRIDLERTPVGQRTKMISMLHACLGEKLAGMLDAAARRPS
jgi:acyl-CoA thioesterase I